VGPASETSPSGIIAGTVPTLCSASLRWRERWFAASYAHGKNSLSRAASKAHDDWTVQQIPNKSLDRRSLVGDLNSRHEFLGRLFMKKSEAHAGSPCNQLNQCPGKLAQKNGMRRRSIGDRRHVHGVNCCSALLSHGPAHLVRFIGVGRKCLGRREVEITLDAQPARTADACELTQADGSKFGTAHAEIAKPEGNERTIPLDNPSMLYP
jgi:hypothetical protein